MCKFFSLLELCDIIKLDAGFTVSGSDAKRTELTDHLTALGAQIQYPQKAENITMCAADRNGHFVILHAL